MLYVTNRAIRKTYTLYNTRNILKQKKIFINIKKYMF